ncbi:MAG: MotA/TolQ/ExbB proton channel family protein [Deltaproteobacteria bacterium]
MKTHLQAILWGLMICLVIFSFQWATAPPAVAQDDAGADPAADDDPEAAPKQKAANGGGGPETAEGGEKNFLVWIIEVSGIIGLVLLILSIYFVATVVRMFMELRPEVFTPLEVLEEGEKLLQARDFTGLYKRIKADSAYFSTVVAAGIAELPNGINEARDAMERVGEVNSIALEKKISMLAVLGTLGPMIGLLGTLKGMIGAFSAIAISGTELKAAQVAGNISEALVLTFEGVALSVPAIYFFALFRNRISAFSAAAMLDADAFVRRLYNAMKSKPAPQAPAPAAPART